jgi:hypothetical protein
VLDLVDKWWGDIRKTVWENNRKETAERNKPPENAIPILKPDGQPYMWLWYEESGERVCMMFANKLGYTIKWTSLTIPDMIGALVQLVADGANVKHTSTEPEPHTSGSEPDGGKQE